MSTRIPFADLGALHHAIRPELDQVWRTAVDTGAFIGGPQVEVFEDDWARYTGSAHAVGVGNGTDALALILMALGIGRGDEVLVPTNTFVATAGAVAMAGATPVFVDVDADTLLVTPETLSEGLTSRTAAVIPVHLYGHVVDMDAVGSWAAEHGLGVVEDVAQAHGATWNGRTAGTFGVASSYSFYPGKNLGALGDGGAVCTDDAVLAERVRALANHGRDDRDRYVHPLRGVNSRLDAVQAGALSVKLRHLDEWTRLRRDVVARYGDGLGPLASRLVAEPEGSASVWHLLVMRVAERDSLRESLSDQGIDTGIHYPVPCHRQKAFSAQTHRPLPVAEAAAREIISLPLFPHMSDTQVDRVVAALRAEVPAR